MSIEELTSGMDKVEVEFYEECAQLQGVSLEEWIKGMKEF